MKDYSVVRLISMKYRNLTNPGGMEIFAGMAEVAV